MTRGRLVKIFRIAAAAMLLGLVAATQSGAPVAIKIPNGKVGIGFDDISFSPELDRLIVPAGRTGDLDLIDPATRKITAISGFSSNPKFGGFHAEGITSADIGAGFIFTTDRDAKRLYVVDPKARKIVASAPLASGPDYVRYVAPTHELWVTEPHAARIEVFSLPRLGKPIPAHRGFIAIPGGPESLVIDATRGRAYTNQRSGQTLAIDLKSRKIVARWTSGCRGSRGLAIDPKLGMLFVGCAEGKLEVLDLGSGKVLGQASSGKGVDIVAYNPSLRHVYMPGALSATMAFVGISPAGTASVLGTVATVKWAHCAAADNRGNVYVCDPVRGRILVYRDPYPASKRRD